MSQLAWQIPLWCLASIIVTRLLLSPFLVYRKCAHELSIAQSALNVKQTEQELQKTLASLLGNVSELRTRAVSTSVELKKFKEEYRDWVEATTVLLDSFGLSADAAIFSNAGSSGDEVEVAPPESDWLAWGPYLYQQLQKHQAALVEIIKKHA